MQTRSGGTIAALALALVATAAGCSSSGTGSNSGSPTAGAVAPTIQQLKAQLLVLQDLPTGWATAPNDSSSSSSSDSTCKGGAALGNSVAGSGGKSAEVTFKQASSSLVPTELLEAVGYDPDASARFSTIQKVFDSCKPNLSTGDSASLTIGQMSFPTVGDQSAAWLISGNASFLSISAPIVLFRKGNYVVLLTQIGGGSDGATSLQAIANKAADKIG
jgi:hypothetical protein